MSSQINSVPLANVTNRPVANQIRELLEKNNIYCVIESDNSASSVLNVISGMTINENIQIHVNEKEYKQAVKILKGTLFEQHIL